MSEPHLSTPLRLFAPAKVNLGLEVLSRRDDGYHELTTVMETVSLYDVIDITPAGSLQVISGVEVPDGDDLVRIGLERLADRTGANLQIQVCVQKSIPIAAGLGGGSSDAGTILGALQLVLDIDPDTVRAVAASLGSDVPFFLRGGTALATGTGTTLRPIQTSERRWYVILVPSLEIPSKTSALYGSLTESDFTNGERVDEIAQCLESGTRIDPGILTSAFQRPLLGYNSFAEAVSMLTAAGAQHIAPSGAGPAMFSICESFDDARRMASRLTSFEGSVHVATSIAPNVNAARIAGARVDSRQ